MEFALPSDIALTGLRALHALVMADGVYDEREQTLMRALAKSLGVEIDVSVLEPGEPASS